MLWNQGYSLVLRDVLSLLLPISPVHKLVPLTGESEDGFGVVHKSFTSSHYCDLMLKQFHFQSVLILPIKPRRKFPFGTGMSLISLSQL